MRPCQRRLRRWSATPLDSPRRPTRLDPSSPSNYRRQSSSKHLQPLRLPPYRLLDRSIHSRARRRGHSSRESRRYRVRRRQRTIPPFHRLLPPLRLRRLRHRYSERHHKQRWARTPHRRELRIAQFEPIPLPTLPFSHHNPMRHRNRSLDQSGSAPGRRRAISDWTKEKSWRISSCRLSATVSSRSRDRVRRGSLR